MNLNTRITREQVAIILKKIFPELVTLRQSEYPILILNKNTLASLSEPYYSFWALNNIINELCKRSYIKRYASNAYIDFSVWLSKAQLQAVEYFESIVEDDLFYVFGQHEHILYMITPDDVVVFTDGYVYVNDKRFLYPLTESFITEVRSCGIRLKLPEAPKAYKVKVTSHFSDTKSEQAPEQKFTLKFSGNVTGAVNISASSEEEAATKLKEMIKNGLPQNVSFSLNYCLTDGAAHEGE